MLLGATVGCAKCHDHKFDKISQKEYFQLQAFFVNASARDDVPVAHRQGTRGVRAAARPLQRSDEVDPRADGRDPAADDRQAGGRSPAGLRAADPRRPSRSRRTSATRYDKWIYHRNLWTMQGRTRNAENRLKEKDKESWNKYQELKAQLAPFDHLKPKSPGNLSTMFELGPDSPPTNILASGIYDRLLDEVQPAFPAAFTPDKPNIVPTATSSGRRTALANWIVSADNPLTARVFVNRVWSQYFGHGISDTVSDFGKQGEKPINPELLDHLAWTVRARRPLEHQVAAAAHPAVERLPPVVGGA